MSNFQENIEILKRMKASSAFSNYIEYIRFPNFKNLEKNTKINFDFPLTFFVGKNGGGKSSTLLSLYGAPKGKSLGDYWFETELDPINDLKTNRNCFIYSVDNNEILKQRAPRKNNLDYWEPSRPVAKYNMNIEQRNSPVDKKVEYIDFRSELSSYDSFMYFSPFNPTKTLKKKQDYIRRYSKKLKEAIEQRSIISLYSKVRNKRVIELTQEEVEIISSILGKNYSSVKIIDHGFFKQWGFSVKFNSPDLSYSEAFAGSGETAIMVLVHRIHNSHNNSLLLLDEPEVSLHPGAQIRLRNYIIEQIKVKKLQVIISTHSPFFIEGMPENAIKVFNTNSNGEFHIENKMNPKEAFYELEVESEKINIIVEDELAKQILNHFLLKLGEPTHSLFNIEHFPGGADELKQRIEVFMNLPVKPYVLLDGDQKIIDEHCDIQNCVPSTIDTIQKLDTKIQDQTSCKIKFYSDGGNDDNVAQKLELRAKYLNFYKDNVFYFPKLIPEEIIWSDDYALNRLTDFNLSHNEGTLNEIKSGDSKEWFVNLCNKTFGNLEHLNTLHTEFIFNWLKNKDENFILLENIITKIKASS